MLKSLTARQFNKLMKKVFTLLLALFQLVERSLDRT